MPFNCLGFEDEIQAGFDARAQAEQLAGADFRLEGALGSDVTLEVTPQTYWQTNAPKAGHASLAFGKEDGPSQFSGCR